MHRISEQDYKTYIELKNRIENRANFLLQEYLRIRDNVFGAAYPTRFMGDESDYCIAGKVSFSGVGYGKIYYCDVYKRRFLDFPTKYLWEDSYKEEWLNQFTRDKK